MSPLKGVTIIVGPYMLRCTLRWQGFRRGHDLVMWDGQIWRHRGIGVATLLSRVE